MSASWVSHIVISALLRSSGETPLILPRCCSVRNARLTSCLHRARAASGACK